MNRFEHDGTFTRGREDVIEAKGSGTRERSIATLKTPLQHTFSASVQVKPASKHSHWRAGILIFDGNTEILCLHIDCYNMIAAYLNTNQRVLYVPANKDLQSFWSTLTIYISEQKVLGQQLLPPTYNLYGCLDQQCFYLANILPRFPLRLSIQAWSDNYKDHDVLIRAISVSEQLSAK